MNDLEALRPHPRTGDEASVSYRAKHIRALCDRIAALEAENARMREERLLDMRKAYEAGYSTCKIGAGLKEGWETFAPTALRKPIY